MANVYILIVSTFVNIIGIMSEHDKWKTISACTTEGVSTVEIDCKSEVIQIGRSHYGVKYKSAMETHRCEPGFDDCIMDYTIKSSELCNGLSRCSMSLLIQFIHKCKDPASYFYLTYRCVKIPSQSDICKTVEYRAKEAHVISPLFPYNYPKNVDCTCVVNRPDKTVLLAEAINFQVQQPDVVQLHVGEAHSNTLSSTNASFIVTHAGPIVLRFQSDSSLSRPGFWMKFTAYRACSSEWEPLDNKCVRIIKHKLPWEFANQKCQSIGGHLLTIRDNTRETRIHHLMKHSGIEEFESVWLGLKLISNSLIWTDGTEELWTGDAIWPWDKSRSKSMTHACAARYNQRWQMEDCSTPKYFICEQDLSRVKQQMLLTCGSTSNLPKIGNNPLFTYSPLLKTDKFTFSNNDLMNSEMAVMRKSKSRQSETIRLGLVLGFMILVLVTLIACNVILVYLCQKRLRKTLRSSAYSKTLRKPKFFFDVCWKETPKKKHLENHRTMSAGYYPDCCYSTCCRQYKNYANRGIHTLTMANTTNHFYEPVIHNATDSGYSTVPKRCCQCCQIPLANSLDRMLRYYPIKDKCNTIDDLLFNKTLSRSNDSISD